MHKKYKQHIEHLGYFAQDYSHQCLEIDIGAIFTLADHELIPPFLIMLLVPNHLIEEFLLSRGLIAAHRHVHTPDIFP